MDRKFTNMLFYAMIFYVFIFFWGILNFIVPVIYFNLFFDFIQFALPATMLIILPLILFLLYFFDERFPFIERHETAMRLIIIISVGLSFLTVFLFAFDMS